MVQICWGCLVAGVHLGLCPLQWPGVNWARTLPPPPPPPPPLLSPHSQVPGREARLHGKVWALRRPAFHLARGTATVLVVIAGLALGLPLFKKKKAPWCLRHLGKGQSPNRHSTGGLERHKRGRYIEGPRLKGHAHVVSGRQGRDVCEQHPHKKGPSKH